MAQGKRLAGNIADIVHPGSIGRHTILNFRGLQAGEGWTWGNSRKYLPMYIQYILYVPFDQSSLESIQHAIVKDPALHSDIQYDRAY